MKVLHLGSGRVGKNLTLETHEHVDIITLDADPTLNPDLLCVLGRNHIDLPDDSIDVAVAHHVLEHIGRQGETKEWFYFFEELYRVLKPGGELRFLSPLYSSVWAWGDPSHVRALSPHSFIFFEQNAYRIAGSPISPFRIRCDFTATGYQYHNDPALEQQIGERVSHFSGVLTTIKPLKPWWVGPAYVVTPQTERETTVA